MGFILNWSIFDVSLPASPPFLCTVISPMFSFVVCLLIKGGTAVNRHLNLIVTISGISHGMQYANISAHTTNNQLLRFELAQFLLKRCIKKGAKAPLGYYLALILS